jgi:hypothetical protein
MSGLIAVLEHATLDEIRAEWGRRYGAPPRLRSPDLLRQILAWRIQASGEGGLDDVTRKLLRKDARTNDPRLAPGAVVVREWNGARHKVEVAEEGFIYGGRRWDSLSGIARAITGTRWNGPRFFGLRGVA